MEKWRAYQVGRKQCQLRRSATYHNTHQQEVKCMRDLVIPERAVLFLENDFANLFPKHAWISMLSINILVNHQMTALGYCFESCCDLLQSSAQHGSHRPFFYALGRPTTCWKV